MTADSIAFVAQIVILPATLVTSVVVMILVAINNHRTARRLSALEMPRGVDQKWQILNAAILAQPTIQRHINPEGMGESERAIVRRDIVFYVLSVTPRLARGKAARIIDHEMAVRPRDEQARFLALFRPEVDEIVARSSVYRAELREFLTRFKAVG